MKKFCLILTGLFFLVMDSVPGYCFMDTYLMKKKVLKWNDSYSKKVILNIRELSLSQSTSCFNGVTVENNTPDTIEEIIVTLIISSNGKEVLKRNVSIRYGSVYPSATITYNACSKPIYELEEIMEQLGDSFEWTYGQPVYIPKFKDESRSSDGKYIGFEIDYFVFKKS